MKNNVRIAFFFFALMLIPAVFSEMLFYDDGTSEEECYPGVEGWEAAEWFTPVSYPCTVTAVMFYPYNTNLLHWKVWDDDGPEPGPPQDPGTILQSGNIYPSTTFDWLTIDVSPPVVITSGDFFIGWEEHAPAYWNGFDQTAPHSNRALFHWESMGLWFWTMFSDPLIGEDGDLLIRAVIGTGMEILEPANKPEKPGISVYPNPFNSAVNIKERKFNGSSVRVEIFDINGRPVFETPVGAYRDTPVIWQPEKSIHSGVYLVRAKIGEKIFSKPVVYIK